jgi:MFS family permease
MATGRMLGILMGPAIGVGLMELLGPARGILVNIFIYVPLVLWCWKAPYGRAVNKARVHAAAAITRLADILETIRMMAANPTLLSMTLITGFASFFVANAYQPQLPEFAQALGATRASAMYGMLFAANAAGAFTAGLVLESRSLLPARTNSVYVLVFIWCCAIIGFALSETYVLSVALLFCAGFVELSFSSMAQTLVQMNAPSAIRGRVIGVYFMSFLGLKSFSGVFVGFGGELIGVHWSLAISAAALLVCMVALRVFDVGAKAVRMPGE